MDQVKFTGRISGDCECFCWDDVPKEQCDEIDDHQDEFTHPGRIYPDDVCDKLGVERGAVYEFTVTAKKVEQ